MNTNEGFLIFLIIVLAILLALSFFLWWYRLRIMNRKISDKRSLEQATTATSSALKLDATEAAYRAALSGVQDGILILGQENRIEFANAAAERIFELETGKSLGLTFIEVVRDYEFDDLLRKTLQSGRQQSASIHNRLSKQYFNVTVIPVENGVRRAVVVTDYTEIKRLEDIRRDLISNISHEFRTPISSIRLLSETLLDGAIKEPDLAEDFLKKIDIETVKLEQMTEELSVLARLESIESTKEKGPGDIFQLIGHSVGRLSALAEKNGIMLEVSAEKELPAPVIDKEQIESVLVNLIHNAIKFTPREGRIKVTAAGQGNSILVSVSDTGIGIPREELPRIFERFYKVDKSRASEGSGLGLAISKHIISAHGGKIWVESIEGQGSTFFFTLPLASV